jgi:hypothetical protein
MFLIKLNFSSHTTKLTSLLTKSKPRLVNFHLRQYFSAMRHNGLNMVSWLTLGSHAVYTLCVP